MQVDTHLSVLAPAGPAAHAIAQLWWAMLAGAVLLTLMVGVLVAWGFRAPGANSPSPRFWSLGMGVFFTLAVLGVLVAAGLVVGEGMQVQPGNAAVKVHAQARQWQWQFTQPDAAGQQVLTHDVLFIPAAQVVDVYISSADVIHSFWVPRLAGKMDAIPGHTNVLRLYADQPGRYDGLSAEFSGTGYGRMRFVVIAYAPGQVPDMAAAQQAHAQSPVQGVADE